MGYIKHHTIIVTSDNNKYIQKAHKKFKKIYKLHQTEKMDIDIIDEILGRIHNTYNSTHTFCIFPDGSKEAWHMSNSMDIIRNLYVKWLNKKKHKLQYIEIMFGGDDDIINIVNNI